MDDTQQLIERGYVARKEGNLSLALELYQAAAQSLHQIEEPLRLAHTIRHVADIQAAMNLLEPAHASYAEALAIYRSNEATSKLDLANTLRGFALLLQTIGDIPAAFAMWTEARSLYSEVEVQAGVEEADDWLQALTHERPSF